MGRRKKVQLSWQEKVEIRAALERGKSIAEVARVFDLPYATVRELNIESPVDKRTPEERIRAGLSPLLTKELFQTLMEKEKDDGKQI